MPDTNNHHDDLHQIDVNRLGKQRAELAQMDKETRRKTINEWVEKSREVSLLNHRQSGYSQEEAERRAKQAASRYRASLIYGEEHYVKPAHRTQPEL